MISIPTVLLLVLGFLLVAIDVNVCVDAYVLSNTNAAKIATISSSSSSRTAFARRPGTMPTFAIAIAITTSTTSTTLKNNMNMNNDDGTFNEEETFTPTRNDNSNDNDNDNDNSPSNSNNKNNYLDDLTPPPVNFARNSILFSENPSTKVRNNSALDAWRFARTYLPAIATGAWPWRDPVGMDERPLAALYNAAFVRLPVLGVGCSYLYQKIAEGHDLVVDFGFDASGPQAIPPVLVLAVLVVILL